MWWYCTHQQKSLLTLIYCLLAGFCFGQTGMPVCLGLRQHLWAVKADAPSTERRAAVAGPMGSLWTTWKGALSGLMPGSVCSVYTECAHHAASTHSLITSPIRSVFFLFACHYYFFEESRRLLCLCKTALKEPTSLADAHIIPALMLLQVGCNLLRYVRRLRADWSVAGSWVSVPPFRCHHVWRRGLLDWLED